MIKIALAGITGLAMLSACATVKVEPIEVKPIHVVVDVNIRVERQLDDFFDFEKELSRPSTQPVAPAAPAPNDQASKVSE